MRSAEALKGITPQPAKAELRETPPSGALVEAAMHRARMEVKQLAGAMGISDSFLLRGFKDQEHISWQRLQRVDHKGFKRALLAVQAEADSGIVTTLLIQIPQEKVS